MMTSFNMLFFPLGGRGNESKLYGEPCVLEQSVRKAQGRLTQLSHRREAENLYSYLQEVSDVDVKGISTTEKIKGVFL